MSSKSERGGVQLKPPLSVAELRSAFLSALYGFRYGFRVRFLHTFFLSLLHLSRRRDSIHRHILGRPLRKAWTHGYNLARFAYLYKIILYMLRRNSGNINIMGGFATSPPIIGRPEKYWHAALAGAFGGWFLWGEEGEINTQILLYLFSRVFLAGIKAVSSEVIAPPQSIIQGKGPSAAAAATSLYSPCSATSFPSILQSSVIRRSTAAAIWAAVMYQFERCPEYLQRGLRSSMEEIYRADEK
uniref:Peroxisomal membrane protein 4 n=1 Tax=Corethron hystrix TaxID=216773 RepID=A0A7S1BD84_9STRA|mmetsp:Transcript_22756/g.52146  ORF Transcript_22756/g.52146 Transcript_22756/m.52146 type:complete len:243 (+) Transcript_22756:37-765(+)